MDMEALRKKFIVDESELKKDLERVVNRAIQYCFVDESGRVHVKAMDKQGKVRAQLALAARAIANQLDGNISPDMSVEEVAACTGLPANQARARLSKLAGEHFAEPVARGKYRANVHRVSQLFDELDGAAK